MEQNEAISWIKTDSEDSVRPLTKEEKKKLKRLNVSEETKRFIAERWSRREKEEKTKTQKKMVFYQKIGSVLMWIFSFILFLSYFDSAEKLILNLGFNYYSNFVLPLENLFTFVLFMLFIIAFLFTASIGIIFLLNWKELEENFKEDISKAWWGFFLKTPLLKKIHGSLLSVIFLSLLIITGHFGIAFLLVGCMIIAFILLRKIKKLYKKYYA